ncbi:MAG: T9SS type A sorting domain-containing protein [Candidatus Kapabacteria bacterium]|nr:T9SS type A sorting domain-containing protein [Candidatus Kapabacteria bacterium]
MNRVFPRSFAYFLIAIMTICTAVATAQNTGGRDSSATQPTDNDQRWVRMMSEPGANFFAIRDEFNRYWANRERQKGDGWKAFKRWEHFWELRVMPDGSFPPAALILDALKQKQSLHDAARADAMQQKKKTKNGNTLQTPQANFTLIGPAATFPANGGAGRLNAVAYHPTNSNIIWVGSPGGGLWRTTNGGSSWTTNTDQFTTLGVSAIAIDPTNTNVMYIGTGDRDASDTYGVGVLKSTDGGNTWNPTGFSYTIQNFVSCAKLLIHPTNNNLIILAASNGIWRSNNGGTNWTQEQTGNFKDMVFMPGSSSVMYATAGGVFYRSLNAGDTWSAIGMGFTTSAVNRIALGVTPHNPRIVYALCSNSSGSTFYGMYRSLDSGSTWTQRSSTPNILGGNSTGNDTRGQGWYDLCMAVNPNDSNDIITGGINMWRSTNGGTNWTCRTMWYTGTSLPYVHADQHDMSFRPGTSTLFVGHDGGLSRSTDFGATWSDLSNGLQITQYYRMSHSSSTSGFMMGGAQDNGTSRLQSGSWAQIYGGDGMDNAIDPGNQALIYASSQNGNFGRSTNSGSSFSSITPSGMGGTGSWITPITLSPGNPAVVWLGYTSLFRSVDRGATWTTMATNVLSGSNATILHVSPSNPNIVVMGSSSRLMRSVNGGTTFTSIYSGLSSSLTEVVFHPTRPDTMVAVASNWTNGSKVFRTFNGGATWTNISGSLPNVPVQCAIMDTTADGIYIGTDIGVYYRNSSMSDWVVYDDGLPNVQVRDMEIFYPTKKLRVATYGRGIWEGNLYSITPIANFTASRTAICVGDTLTLRDLSSNAATRLWAIGGAIPAVDTSATVVATFNTVGTYSVKLTVSNPQGSDSLLRIDYITVRPRPNASFTWNKTTACVGDSIVLTGPASMRNYLWSTGDTTRRLVLRLLGTSNITLSVVDTNGCSASSGVPQTFTMRPAPAVTIVTNGATALCEGESLTLSTDRPFNSYLWSNNATTQSITVTQAGTYTVQATDSSSCIATAQITITVSSRPTVTLSTNGRTLFCEGGSVLLRATTTGGALTHRWTRDTTVLVGEEDALLNAQLPGVYRVRVINEVGCSRLSDSIVVGWYPAVPLSVTSSGKTTLCQGDSVTLTASAGFKLYAWNTGATTRSITVKTSGTYSVSTIDSNDCQRTTSNNPITVSVSNAAPPVIRAQQNKLSICEGDSVLLEPTAAFAGYTWSNGATSRSIMVKTEGAYSLTGRTNDGCSLRSNILNVIVLPAPAKPSLRRSADTLITTATGDIQWYKDGSPISGATQQRHLMRETGRYNVVVKNGSGCTVASDPLDILSSVAVEQSAPAPLTLEPNPASESVTVRFAAHTDDHAHLRILLFDASGRTVYQSQELGATTTHRIPLTGFASGAYVVVLRAGGRTIGTAKLIKE